MLFGGLEIQPLERGGMSGIMDDWILCRGDQLDYQLMTTLRKELDCVLCGWLRQGRRNGHGQSGQETGRQEAVLQTVVDALHYHGRHPSVMQRPRNPSPDRGFHDSSDGFRNY